MRVLREQAFIIKVLKELELQLYWSEFGKTQGLNRFVQS